MKAEKEKLLTKAYSEHYKYIYCMCLYFVRYNSHDADDLTSEVFLTYSEQLLSGKLSLPENKIRAWLISVAKNKFSEYSLKRSKFGTVVDIHTLSDTLEAPQSNDFEDLLYERLLKENIDTRIIEQLTEDEQMLLHYVKDKRLKYKEIGNILDIKPTTVAQRVLRLKRKIRKLIQETAASFSHILVTVFLLIF